MSDRYVSVKSLKTKLSYIFRSYGTSNTVKEAVKEAINKLPSADVVEVVRCKNCIYFTEEHRNGQGICCCDNKDTNYNAEFKPYADDYCSYGERGKRNESVSINQHTA